MERESSSPTSASTIPGTHVPYSATALTKASTSKPSRGYTIGYVSRSVPNPVNLCSQVLMRSSEGLGVSRLTTTKTTRLTNIP